MKNFRREGMTRSIISALCFFGALCLAGTVAVAQSGTAKDSCDAVHAAYRKSFQANSQMSTKDSGAVNVTKAQAEITGDGSYTESCKLLREETLSGEAASVHSDRHEIAFGNSRRQGMDLDNQRPGFTAGSGGGHGCKRQGKTNHRVRV